MKLWYVFVFFMVMPALLWAETYSGQVLNGTTQLPMVDATIAASDGVRTRTNAQGYFQLESAVPQVRVSHPGFQEKNLVLQNVANRIELFEYDVYEMDQFVVVAEKDDDLIKISKQKLSHEVIKQTTVTLFPDVMKVVQLLPGVTSAHEFSSLLFVRGGDPNEVLAILDNMVIMDPYLWGGSVSIFNPNLVESVDFYSGGFSAEWPQAMSGILKVKNKIGNPEKFKGFVDLSATTLDVFVEGPFWGPEASSFMLGLRRTHYDLIIGLFFQDENLVFPFFYDGQFKINMPFENNMIAINSIYSFEGMRMSVKPEEGYGSENVEEMSFQYKDLNMNLSVSSDYQISEDLSVLTLLGVYYNQGDFSFDNSFSPFNMDREQAIMQLRHVWQWEVGGGHKVRSGLYYFPATGEANLKRTISIPTSNNTRYEETIETKLETDWINFAGVFAQDEMTIIDKLLYANPSVNVQYYTANSQWMVNPRLMFKVQPQRGWEITLASGLYSQYPISAQQIDDELGNSDLRAEEAIHYVLGTKINIEDDLSVQVDGYYKDYRNLIVSDDDSDINYTNHERGYAFGVDIMIKKEFGGKWDGWLTYSYLKNRRRIDQRTDPTTLGMPESNTPYQEWYAPGSERPHTLNLIANYNFSKEWKLALTQKFASGKLYTPIVGATYQPAINEYIPVSGEYNSGRYPSYFSTDIKLTMPLFELESGYAYLQVSNLFNVQNVNSDQYKTDYSDKREINQLPRLIIGGVRFEF
jgi:outer membrane receptor protein involved in Fe transport